jgi:hypothetical protein
MSQPTPHHAHSLPSQRVVKRCMPHISNGRERQVQHPLTVTR